jgi:secondary thiamine-phosphate synthase enzyme
VTPSGNSVFLESDDEYGLHMDYEKWLEELVPHAPTSQYQHNRTGEDNADAHLKRAAETRCTSQIMGRDVLVAVTNGRLDFGTWERIFYGEFDDRRRERVQVKIVGE